MTPYRTSSAPISCTPLVVCQVSGAHASSAPWTASSRRSAGTTRDSALIASAPVDDSTLSFWSPSAAVASPARIACSARASETPAALATAGSGSVAETAAASGAAGVFRSHAAATKVRSASCAPIWSGPEGGSHVSGWHASLPSRSSVTSFTGSSARAPSSSTMPSAGSITSSPWAVARLARMPSRRLAATAGSGAAPGSRAAR